MYTVMHFNNIRKRKKLAVSAKNGRPICGSIGYWLLILTSAVTVNLVLGHI